MRRIIRFILAIVHTVELNSQAADWHGNHIRPKSLRCPATKKPLYQLFC